MPALPRPLTIVAMHRAAPALLALLALACARPEARPAPPLALERTAQGAGTRLLLVPAQGARIGVDYKPTLTLQDGAVVRFDTSAVTADSGYFAAPPAAEVDRAPDDVHGQLKASVCREHEAVCRLIKMEV